MASNTAFGATAQEIAELFTDYLEGDSSRPALSLSRRPLDPASRNAIEKSLGSFGYPPQSCTYATLLPVDPDVEGGDVPLDAHALFALIEGLDPICIIAADADSTAALAQTYRTQLPTTEAVAVRIFGRQSALFSDLPSLMNSESGKQKAWSALKTLGQ